MMYKYRSSACEFLVINAIFSTETSSGLIIAEGVGGGGGKWSLAEMMTNADASLWNFRSGFVSLTGIATVADINKTHVTSVRRASLSQEHEHLRAKSGNGVWRRSPSVHSSFMLSSGRHRTAAV